MADKQWVIGEAHCPYRFVFRRRERDGIVTLRIHDAKDGTQLLPPPIAALGVIPSPVRSIGFTIEQQRVFAEIGALAEFAPEPICTGTLVHDEFTPCPAHDSLEAKE